MRSTALATVILAYTTLSAAIQLADLLRFTSSCSTLPTATLGSTLYQYAPAPKQSPGLAVLQNLDLRDVPPVVPAPATLEKPVVDNANEAAPNANPAAPAAPGNPALNPAADPAQPVAPANPAVPANPIAPVDPAVPANPVAPAPVAPTIPPAVAPADPAAPVPDPANPAAGPGAVPSVTVQWVETWIGGTSQTWVPRTITFKGSAGITQAPAPGKGEIGMGTVKGQVGITRTVVVAGAPTIGAEGWRKVAVAAVGVGIGVAGVL